MKQPTNKNHRPFTRKYKAYKTALVVTLSYLKLNLVSKILGKKYYKKRIQALHLKNANRVKDTILELQGLFIKIGQLISILSNVLPDEFREPLESLQDKIPARSYAEVEQTIIRELGKTPNEIFTTFNKEPLAAASIGQVHRATLDGREIVVKVQHLNIPVTSKADLVILKNLVRIHAFFMDMKGLDHLYEQVKQMVSDELDYKREANSMNVIRENLQEEVDLRVIIPEVFEEYSTKRVLVTEFCEGVKIGEVAQLDSWEIDRADLAQRLLELYCKMVLIDGFYQADPHPGNILVNSAGDICLLDYGATARLTETTKTAIPELLEAVLKDNTENMVKALKKMGFLADGKEAEIMMENLIEVFRRFLLDEVELNGMNFKEIKLKSGLGAITNIISQVDIRDVSDTVQIPKDYVLLYRAAVLLLGVSFQIAPELNPIDIVKPYIEKNLVSKKDTLKTLVVNTLKGQLTTALALPQDLHRFLKDTSRGETEVKIKGIKPGFELLWWMGQMIFFGGITIITAGVIWLSNFKFQINVLQGLYAILGVSGFFFLRAWMRGGKVRKGSK